MARQRRNEVLDSLTRHSLAFALSSRAVRKPDVRVSRDSRFWRPLVRGLTRTMRSFRQDAHHRGVLTIQLDSASLEHYDLAGCDLSGFHVAGADLRRAHLRGCDFTHASLFRTVLEGADLTDARLRRADLREADLGAARLVRTDLRASHLQGAVLRHADLRGARLHGADLSGADLRDAILDEGFDRSTVACDAATQWPASLTTPSR